MATAEDRSIADEQRTLIEHLLRERISLRGICRAVDVSLTWLLHFMIECFATCPDHLHVELPREPTDVVIRQLEAEADEMWSFVRRKPISSGSRLLWMAGHAKSLRFTSGIAVVIAPIQLWAKIPVMYREQATFHTDQYDAYQGVIPAERHKAITEKARKTNHIERFNNTLQQRLWRLVRETLSFSKKLAHHIGAIKYFICHYNLMRAAALPVQHDRY